METHRSAMRSLAIAHITSPADNRMRTRTALEQLAEAQRQDAEEVPDADDQSARQEAINNLWSL